MKLSLAAPEGGNPLSIRSSSFCRIPGEKVADMLLPTTMRQLEPLPYKGYNQEFMR